MQKGEHAVAKFPVWKFKAGGKGKEKDEQEAGDDEKPKEGKCYMRMAFFFTVDQVKKM